MHKHCLLRTPVAAPLAALLLAATLLLLATALLLAPLPRLAHAHAQAGTGAVRSSYSILRAQPE
jgi:hypothetical protein